MSRRNIIARLVRMAPRIRSLGPYLSTRKLGRVLHTLLPSIIALSLREISGDQDPHFNSKAFITPVDKAAKDRIVELPVFAPISEQDEVKQKVEATQATQAVTLQAETKEQSYRSQYPGTLNFDYNWDKKKGKSLGLQQIWRDDKFTYLRVPFQETPAHYEVRDKKPSLMNFDFSNGLYHAQGRFPRPCVHRH